MDFLAQLLQPSGLWENFVFGLDNIIRNYGLTLILITLIIKFAMLPFDLLNKYITKNNSRKQARLQPQVDKLKKAYANNPQMLNQKTMELYKRENYSVFGTCFGMLINLVITSVVFITLLGALNNISTYKQSQEFLTLQTTYYEVVLENLGHNVDELTTEEFNDLKAALTQEELNQYKLAADDAVIEKYGDIKVGFLWIKNIWKQDTTTSAILTYKEFKDIAKDIVTDHNITEESYNLIMDPVKSVHGGANGWYLLVILSASTSFLSMKISTWVSKHRAKKQNKPFVDPLGTNKVLIYLMPAIMAIFTLFYNAAFGIYVVTGSLFSLITSPLITLLADKIDSIAENKENKKTTVSYSRKK